MTWSTELDITKVSLNTVVMKTTNSLEDRSLCATLMKDGMGHLQDVKVSF